MRPVPLEASLRAARDGGRKLLVPYVTGGLGPDWVEVIQAMVAAGADAVEIGHPVLRPGDGRPDHPGGVAAGPAARGDTRLGSWPSWAGWTSVSR